MNLNSPITITPPPFIDKNGVEKTPNPIVLNELDVTIIDNSKRKIVSAHIRPAPRPMLLWEKEAYDQAGDYTQAMVEARVLQLLGTDPTKVLTDLYKLPSRPAPPAKT
jgi:hypothetical protein